MVRPSWAFLLGVFNVGKLPMEKHSFDTAPDAQMIRTSQFCELVGISRTTLWRQVKAGHIPKPVKVTDGIRAWSMGTARAFLKSRAQA